jgi:hypothetical protein
VKVRVWARVGAVQRRWQRTWAAAEHPSFLLYPPQRSDIFCSPRTLGLGLGLGVGVGVGVGIGVGVGAGVGVGVGVGVGLDVPC